MSTAEVSDTLAAIWKEQLDTDVASADDNFVAIGGTSIGAVHLAATIQERLGVAVDAIEILERGTFGQISQLVNERAQLRRTLSTDDPNSRARQTVGGEATSAVGL